MSRFEVKQVLGEVDGDLVLVLLNKSDTQCLTDLICTMAEGEPVKVIKLNAFSLVSVKEALSDSPQTP